MPLPAAQDVLRLYQRHAATFDRLRDQSLFERHWLDAFLGALPQGAGHILDLGCGSGAPTAQYLIANGCRITGIDGAEAMIARAAKRFPAQDWRVADMRDLPRMGPFDGIVAWHSLFHLPPEDQPSLFENIARRTHPGGALMFTSGTEHGETLGSFEGQPLYHGSLESDAYRTILHALGFDVVHHIARDPSCGGATVWLARKRDRIGEGGARST